MIKRLPFPAAGLFFLLLCSCNSSTVQDIKDSLQEPDRKTIDTSTMGVNAFVNDLRFGGIQAQFFEVRDTLRLSYVRVLMDWNEQIQPSAQVSPNFSFYDSIVADIPAGVGTLIVATSVPAWVAGRGPAAARESFANDWLAKVFERYGRSGTVEAFEIWNEPNDEGNPDNMAMGFTESASNYAEVLARAQNLRDQLAPGKLIVSAGTTAINQNYPTTLDYNRALRDAGGAEFVDVWGMHYYGKQYENVVRSGGVEDFVNGLPKPVWITESGHTGVNGQLEYVERTWPFLREHMPSISRIYYYQFTEASAADVTYGLKNLTAGLELSDLYVWLRGR